MKRKQLCNALLSAVLMFLFAHIGTAQEIKIGTQTWTSVNLNVSKFRNGDVIPEMKTNAEWEKAGADSEPAWCYYDNNVANDAKYGRLYNWYAITDTRGLAPDGWHVATKSEFNTVLDFLGKGESAAKKMKTKSGWDDRYGYKGNGNNKSGFTALPGGYRNIVGEFYDSGFYGYWWSTSPEWTGGATSFVLTHNASTSDFKKACGFSVRCVKD